MTKLLGLLTIVLLQLPTLVQASNEQFLAYLQMTPSNFQTVAVYSYSEDLVEVDDSLHEQLLSIAQSQSGVWGDTILEGDVAAMGEIRLDTIEELMDGALLIGYRITYSQQAWATGTCDLSQANAEDWRNPDTFAQCAEGRIYESAFVTADLATYFADYDAVAHLELND